MTFFKSFLTIWTQPRATIRYARDRYSLTSVFVLFVAMTMFNVITSLITDPSPIGIATACGILILALPASLLCAWSLKKVAGWLSSEATVVDILYSVYIYLFTAPLFCISVAFPFALIYLLDHSPYMPAILFFVMSIVGFVWGWIISFIGLGELLKFKKGNPAWRAFFSCCLLGFIMLGLCLIIGFSLAFLLPR